MDATVASAWQMPKNIRRKRSRRGVAAWKQVAVLCLLAGSSGWTDGSLTSTEAPDADEDLRIRRSELTCANGECGGADVLKVVSQLAKRLLSDPRILSLNSGTSGADQSGRSSRINSRPFTSGSYYKTRPSAADRQRIADLFSAASDSGSFRQKESRYIDDYDSADKNSIQAANSVAANDFFTNYFVTADVSDVNDVSSSSKNDDDVTRDSYDEGDSYSAGDTYSGGHGGHAGHGGDSYGGDHGGDSYGGGHGGDSYGGGCCNEKDQYLPILVVGSLGLLAFYLYLRTTNGGGRRRRRRFADDEHVPDVLLDGPAWLGLVHQLWTEQDGAPEDPSCAQETLCRMNRMAMAAPGQTGWAVSLSSMPLSYLLHIRHTGGFTSYIDASLMGRSGANCTQLYSSCSRFH